MEDDDVDAYVASLRWHPQAASAIAQKQRRKKYQNTLGFHYEATVVHHTVI